MSNYTPQKRQDNRQYLLNKYTDSKSIYASNSKLLTKEDPSRKSLYSRSPSNPNSNRLQTPSRLSSLGIDFSKLQNNLMKQCLAGYDRNLVHSRFRGEEANYLAKNSNRKIIPSWSGYEGPKPKLHSTYFKEVVKKNKF